MVYEERNIWTSLVVSVIGVVVYVLVILQQAGGGPLTETTWWPTMLWVIGGSILAAIILSILWGIVAGRRDPEAASQSDERDREIAHMSSRVGQAFLIIAGLGIIVLSALEAHWFWIANTMFFGFALSSIIGGIASVIAYRRGLV
ncbi:MAG: hypothetical protein ACTHXA_04530 [Gulosibacter sp.]|uniref:hypothetical protein n=1 Tax=Gulosibacter sp. TaxID=2817531 RepID=UPI003F8E6FB8